MSIRLAIAGATGLVGEQLLSIMEEEGALTDDLGLFASESSRGARITAGGREYTVQALSDCNFADYDAAFFCIGDELSEEYVPRALAAGCAVVDKSNAFRLAPGVPLVVSGVNDTAVSASSRLVANPNCSTIILCHALSPLTVWGLKKVWAATYQSVSGAGRAGSEALSSQVQSAKVDGQLKGHEALSASNYAYNVVPSIGRINDEGRCSEEQKLVDETRKILDLPQLPVIAHAARVPVYIGHSIAVTVELANPAIAEELHAAFSSSSYLNLPQAPQLPGPVSSSRHDEVELGRLRSEDASGKLWSFFISGDNLRLGAALNGWRILQVMNRVSALGRAAVEN